MSGERGIAVLGQAGSGKTTCIKRAINRASNELGARVLIVAPTGILAASFRAAYPQLDVDTIHGAFQVWKPVEQTLELMYPFDLIVVEEVASHVDLNLICTH